MNSTHHQACSCGRAWSKPVPSSRRCQGPRRCSVPARESWPGPLRRSQSRPCRQWSRQRTTACWAPWTPEEEAAGRSWLMECCPLFGRVYTGNSMVECCYTIHFIINYVFMKNVLTLWVLGASANGVGWSMLLSLRVHLLREVGSGRGRLEYL